MPTTISTGRHLVLRGLLAVTVFGGVYGMAAGLGGLTTGALGAEDGVVGSCDADGVATAFQSGWDAANDRFGVTAVEVSGIDSACAASTLRVALVDGAGDVIGSGSTSVAASSHVVPVSAAPAASLVSRVHVTIGG